MESGLHGTTLSSDPERTTERSLDVAQRNPGSGVMVEQFPRISLRCIRATGSGFHDESFVGWAERFI